eukprot:958011_1
MSNFPSCNNATYTSTMYESHSDHLSKGDIFISSNCTYLLRAETNALSLYSSSQQSMIKQWDIHDTIWSIKVANTPQTLSLSDNGCLTWSTENRTTIISQYCDPYISTTHYNTTSIPIHNASNHSNNNLTWIPISICIIAVILGFIAMIMLIIRRRRPQSKYLMTHRDSNSQIIRSKNGQNFIKQNYMSDDSDVQLGLNVPIRYNNDSTDSDDTIEIHENVVENELIERHKQIGISISDLSDSSSEAP